MTKKRDRYNFLKKGRQIEKENEIKQFKAARRWAIYGKEIHLDRKRRTNNNHGVKNKNASKNKALPQI